VFGPSHAAAEVAGSKVFAKRFMAAHNIPTARFAACDSADETLERIRFRGVRLPVVLKADGLAAGKGVIVAPDEAAAVEAVQRIMVDRAFGKAGDRVVVEEFLTGREVTFIVFTDGAPRVVPLASSQDYKRLSDGDQGPNTGGDGLLLAGPSPDHRPQPDDHGNDRVSEPGWACGPRDGAFSGRSTAVSSSPTTGRGAGVQCPARRSGDPEASSSGSTATWPR